MFNNGLKALLATTAIVAAGSVAAQEISYGGLLGSYGYYTDGDNDLDLAIYGGELGIQIDSFDMWVNGLQADLTVDDSPVGLNADLSTIGVGYSFGNGMRADVSSSSLGVGLGGFGLNFGLTEFGLGYDSGSFFGRVSFTDVSDSYLELDGIYGLMVGYEVMEGTEVSLSVHQIDEPNDIIDEPIYVFEGSYDGGRWGAQLDAIVFSQDGLDLSLVSLGGDYDITGPWGAYGSYSRIDLDGTEIDSVRLGGSYDFGNNITAYVDLSQTMSDDLDDDVTGLSVGVTMDLGDKPTSWETTGDRIVGVLEPVTGLDF